MSRAIELNKTYSGAFLLNAYAQRDKGLWVRSIYSFQMFLLLEPDSKRSKNAFEEMLQTMLVKPITEKPVERSFTQQQMMQNTPDSTVQQEIPPLSTEEGLNRNFVYNAIKSTTDSLKAEKKDTDVYLAFVEVNKAILITLEKETGAVKAVVLDFPLSFFKSILNPITMRPFAATLAFLISRNRLNGGKTIKRRPKISLIGLKKERITEKVEKTLSLRLSFNPFMEKIAKNSY